MVAVLLALSNLLLGPAFVQGLSNRRRAAIALFAAYVLALVVVLFTMWGMALYVAVVLASIVDGFLGLRRIAPPIRWSGVWGGGAVAASLLVAVVANLLVLEAFKFPSSSMSPTFEIGDHIFINKLQRSPDRGDVIVFAQPCRPQVDYIKRVLALPGDTVEIRCGRVHLNGLPLDEQLVEQETTYRDYAEGYGGHDAAWFSRDVSRYRETNGGHTYDTFHSPDRPARSGGTPSLGEDLKDFPRAELRNCANPEHSDAAPVDVEQAPGTLVETNSAPESPCALHRHYVVPAGHVFVMGDNRANSNDSRFWGSVPVANVRGTVIGVWWPLGRFGARD